MLTHLMDGLYNGSQDGICQEMCRFASKASAQERFMYPKLAQQKTIDAYNELLSADTQRSHNIELLDSAVPDDPSNNHDEDVPHHGHVSGEAVKERLILEARNEHAKACKAERIVVRIRPQTKPHMEAILKEDFVVGRRSHGHGRALFYMDVASEREPQLEHDRHSWVTNLPTTDTVYNNMFWKSVVNICSDKDDVYAQADGKSKTNNIDFCKVTSSCQVRFQLTIGYGENEMRKLGCRGRMQLSEHVDMKAPHKFPIRIHPRKHFTSTSTQSNEIYQANVLSDVHKVPKHTEEIIFNNQENFLLPSERDLDALQEIPCFHHEKTVELYEELIHHVDADVVVVGSPATGNMALAMLNMGRKGLLLARNDAHAEVINDRITRHILSESMKPNNEFTLQRADVIERLGLEPDAAGAQDNDSVADGSADGGDPSGEEGAEEEEDGQQEEAEEQDEHHEEPEEESDGNIDDALFGDTPKKGDAKLKAKGKAKSAGKRAKATGGGKAKGAKKPRTAK